MTLHHLPLLGSEAVGLVENRLIHPDFPDIVHESCNPHAVDLPFRQPQLLGKECTERTDTLGVCRLTVAFSKQGVYHQTDRLVLGAAALIQLVAVHHVLSPFHHLLNIFHQRGPGGISVGQREVKGFDGNLLCCILKPVNETLSLIGSLLCQQEDKLITAISSDNYTIVAHTSHELGGLLQHSITHLMTERVVYELQAVDVNDKEGERHRSTGLLECILEIHSAVQPGQEIMVALEQKFLLIRFLFGDVPANNHRTQQGLCLVVNGCKTIAAYPALAGSLFTYGIFSSTSLTLQGPETRPFLGLQLVPIFLIRLKQGIEGGQGGGALRTGGKTIIGKKRLVYKNEPTLHINDEHGIDHRIDGGIQSCIASRQGLMQKLLVLQGTEHDLAAVLGFPVQPLHLLKYKFAFGDIKACNENAV
ncbi:hypothetical protein DSECCO2_630500 [anaerobic digester metagenome]